MPKKNNQNKLKNKKSKLRNLSPFCFEAKQAIFDDNQLKEIEKIKNKYNISPDFCFADHLGSIPIEIASFQEGKKQIPTIKEKHQYVDAIRQKAEELLDLIHSSGSLILRQIARNTENSFKTISQIRDKDLPKLIAGCEITKYQLPPIKRGRHRDPLKLAIIYHLVNLYTLATGKEPSCGYDDIQKSHIGDCFDFICDLNSYILKSLTLSFDKESTIGQYLHENLQFRTKEILRGYAALSDHLLSNPKTNAQLVYSVIHLEKAFLLLKAHPHIT